MIAGPGVGSDTLSRLMRYRQPMHSVVVCLSRLMWFALVVYHFFATVGISSGLEAVRPPHRC
jgi:hypothetical protein